MILVGVLFSFKHKIIPNNRSICVSIRFLEQIDCYPIRLVSLSESERSTPLRYENHAEKSPSQWKQKVYPIWKLEWGESDPVWWKHSIRILGNQEISRKCLNFIEWYPSVQSSCWNERFFNLSRKLLKNRN